MQHSNVFYIRKGGKDNPTYEPIRTATAVKNEYGFDVFRHDHGKISCGKTGLALCSPAGNIKSFEDVISKYGAEKLTELIENAVKTIGYTPRYTQPDVMKKDLFEPTEKKQPSSIMAMDGYGEKHRYIKIYDEGGIVFYILEKQEKEFNATLYVLLNGVMIGIDQRHCIDEAKRKMIQMGDFAEYAKFILDKQLANPNTWADPTLGIALDMLDKVREHNAPIRAKRDAEHEEYEAMRKAEREEFDRRQREKYENAIAEAKAKLKAHKEVQNVNITNPDTGWETSVVLHLMKENGIKVPLKTQGWINDTLASLVPQPEGYSYRYFKRKNCKESSVFHKYLNEFYEVMSNGN